MLFAIKHLFLTLKNRKKTPKYMAVKNYRIFLISKHDLHSVSSNCDKYNIPLGRETEPYFSGATIPEYLPTGLVYKGNYLCFRGENKHAHCNE
jgi:hypothetical protein